MKMKNDVIAYTVNKVMNRECYICVQNGEVLVQAPWYLSQNQIQAMVEQKKKWILQKRKEYIQKKEKVTFDTFKILGEKYALKISYKNVKSPSLTVDSTRVIEVILPKKYRKAEKEEILQVLLEKMYKVIAEKELEAMMEKTRLILGIAPEDYEIRQMENALAKCLPNGKILLHPNLIKYSRKCIEYVLLHEFCHLKYKKHCKGFYQMIERYIPDYKKYANEVSNLQY